MAMLIRNKNSSSESDYSDGNLDLDYSDVLGGVALGGVSMGGTGSKKGAKKNEYIKFLKEAKSQGITFKDKADRAKTYKQFLKALPEARAVARGKKPAKVAKVAKVAKAKVAKKSNPYIQFLQEAKVQGIEFKDKADRAKTYQEFLKALPEARAVARGKKPAKVKKIAANKYDKYEVRKRLFGKDAKKPLRNYDRSEKKTLNKDLKALGSGVCMSCPHCGGEWYDVAWDVIKTVAPVVLPLFL